MKKRIYCIILLIAAVAMSSCKGHKDCQGRRHTVKTDMGGWL